MSTVTSPAGTFVLHSNGNRTSRETGGGATVWLVYDDENQLIRQETDTWNTPEANRFRLEYVYDGKLRLRERRYFTWLNGTWYSSATDRYVYDGMLVVQERSTTAPTVSYTRGLDLSGGLDGAGGIGGLLTRSHGFSAGSGTWSTHTAYHADGNGNVTALFSTSTGSQVGWYRYDAFGRLLGISGTLAGANRMRFSSKPWMAPEVDDSAGMYYYGYRFYDPVTQRWLNRDPRRETGFEGIRDRAPAARFKRPAEATARPTLYTFAGNNGVNDVDSMGLKFRNYFTGDGVCCNFGSQTEWAVVEGKWKMLPIGECTDHGWSTWDEDCDGMTCQGRFYYNDDPETNNCNQNGPDPNCQTRGWTPSYSMQGALPPGAKDADGRLYDLPKGDHRGVFPVTPPLYTWVE